MDIRPERKSRIDKVLDHRQPDLALVMENVEDPHNIGAVMRSADSAGIQEVYVINTLIGIHEFRKKKSAGSAEKWMHIHQFTSVDKCVLALREKGFQLWATHLGTAARSLYEVDLTQKVALVFGRERGGLSEALLHHCDGNFIIPQFGMVQSLNVSVACAISVYEAVRQRQLKGMYDGTCRYPESERKALFQEWTKHYAERTENNNQTK